jgi:hypothetical protein
VRRFLDARAERAAGRARAKRPEGLARLASAANATNESGAKRRKQEGSGRANGWARAAQLAEPERASHSGGPPNFLVLDQKGCESFPSFACRAEQWVEPVDDPRCGGHIE